MMFFLTPWTGILMKWWNVLTDHGGRTLQLSLMVHEASSTQNLLSPMAMLPLPVLSSVRVKGGSFTARASPKPVLRRSWMQPPGYWCTRVSPRQCGDRAMLCRAVLGCQALPRLCCSVSAHPGATRQLTVAIFPVNFRTDQILTCFPAATWRWVSGMHPFRSDGGRLYLPHECAHFVC